MRSPKLGSMAAPTRRGFVTSEGTNAGAFGPTEWGLLSANALIWGSSFLWIKIGLDVLHPGALAFIRVALGASAVWLLASTRRSVPREAMPTILVIGVAGTIAPALLFAFAEQRIESSVAGMVNSAGPLLTLGVSIAMSRKFPERIQMIGLAIGFVGGILLAIPNLTGADAEPLGVLLVVIAVCCYSLSSNLLPPLVQEFGAAPIMGRALAVSALLLLPYGGYGLTQSSFSWPAAIAMLILGVFGTGVARVFFALLVSRAGAPRAGLVGYLVPLVAVILGIVFLGESVSVLELAGLGLILVAANFVGRTARTMPARTTASTRAA